MIARVLSVLLALTFATAQQAPSKWAEVEKSLGRSGQESDGIYKVSLPRSDLDVHIGQTKLEPGAALGSWAAFYGDGNNVVTDGDLVATGDELGGVVSALQAHKLEVTGVHNHLAGETPAVYYVHFFGRGSAGELSSAVDAALKATKTPRGPASAAAVDITYDRATIEKVLGKPGQAKGNVLAFSFPRSHRITMHYIVLPPAMGMATAINFQPSGQPSSRGVGATGDFVVEEAQVQAVVRALRDHNILVTALHNHLLNDSPRMVFIHFWAEGPAADVAQGLRAALDASNTH
jgi:hypothetical protein